MKQYKIFLLIVITAMSINACNSTKSNNSEDKILNDTDTLQSDKMEIDDVYTTQSNSSDEMKLDATMTDEQILHAFGLEIKALQSEKTQGKDGYSTTYSDDVNEIHITRSMVTGLNVWRSKPVDIQQTWKLGKE